ncbi:MAG: GIY-YIG nuclease family protein [Patescibacteria group bacterium]
MPRWVVYILRCKNGSLYTGITNNLEARVAKHNAGMGAKYTRAFGPVRIVYSKVMRTATAARKHEAKIKGWTKAVKEKLVKDFGLK